jgi:hypothetical protein
MLEPIPPPTEIAKSPENGAAIETNEYRPFYRRKGAVFGLLGFVIGDAVLSFLIGGISLASISFFITSLLSFLVVYLIAVQAEIYAQQWEAMQQGLTETRKLIAQTERHFILTERPTLSVENPQLAIVRHDDSRLISGEPKIFIRNTGKVPARKVAIQIFVNPHHKDSVRSSESPEPYEHSVEPHLDGRPVIAPGGELVTYGDEIDFLTLDAIVIGDIILFVWIKIAYEGYEGMREKPYFVEFYGRYEAEGNRCTICSTHNDAD